MPSMIIATQHKAARRRAGEVAGLLAASSAMAPLAGAQEVPSPAATPTAVEDINVIGQLKPDTSGLGKLPGPLLNTPESIDVITQAAIRQQSATTLQDALKYAPGITLNSGEGGAHGDNVNLRGFHAIDSFFLDGIRDPGSYTRDNFDLENIEILQGPASVLFGNGSPGGAINETSKQPGLTPLREVTLEGGTNDEARGTFDINEPIGPHAAIRVNLMGETTNVADRDYVNQKRWGVAPSLALGINTPTTLTLNFFHQEENNVPDYGIPFLFGKPAPVNRSFYYGLKNSDVTQTNVDIATVTATHAFNDNLLLTNTTRYARYGSTYRVDAPIFGSDFAGGPPDFGTPLSQILVYRDRPSSSGVQTYLTNHTDLTSTFQTGPFAHTLVSGVEVGRQTTDGVRYNNDTEGVDGIEPTPLLGPDAYESAPDQKTIDSRPDTHSNNVGVYATDSIRLTPALILDLGVRYDIYYTHFDDSVSNTTFKRTDSYVSPKAAIVYKPTAETSLYASFTKSFDPAASYLTLAPNTKGPPPQTAKTFEVGGKARWLHGRLTSTVALFSIDAANTVISDPDDPTVQQLPGDRQRVRGFELTTTGHITREFEITANYTVLDPKITGSSDPTQLNRFIPGAAIGNANIWAVYEPREDLEIGTGLNYVGHRFADSANTAQVPGYVVWNAVIGYQVLKNVHVQLNIQNITDQRYFTGAYYTDDNENHVLPGQGRVASLKTGFTF